MTVDPDLYDEALDLSYRTGWGVERCMVYLQKDDIEEVQNAQFSEKIHRELEEAMQAMFNAMQPVIEDFVERMIAASQAFQDALEAQGSSPPQPSCPSHGRSMRGGRCSQCDRRCR